MRLREYVVQNAGTVCTVVACAVLVVLVCLAGAKLAGQSFLLSPMPGTSPGEANNNPAGDGYGVPASKP
jgi:hypothetical protein